MSQEKKICKIVPKSIGNQMNADDLEEIQEAINQMAQAFEILENYVKDLDLADRENFLNPVTFGPISQFLGRGAGYEPGIPGSQFHSSEDLIEICSDYVEDDEDDEDDEDEDEE
jgi:hypothetical protein